MKKQSISIDYLIKIVINGGVVQTGIDVYNNEGILLLEKNVLVSKVAPLLVIKKSGVLDIPIDQEKAGGIWDKNGFPISIQEKRKTENKTNIIELEIEKRIQEIRELKKEASVKYQKAKNNLKKVLRMITENNGEFDMEIVTETVSDVINFLTQNETAFSYVTKEIFSYDDYLYNHSVNVCTIGVAVLKKFNDHFSEVVNHNLSGISFRSPRDIFPSAEKSFIYYLPEDIHDMAMGLFLHDMGKVLIPDAIINKKGRLSPEEYNLVKTHSYEKGIELLELNKLFSSTIKNIVSYHHGPIYESEPDCYPTDKTCIELPVYVKICKLADIYDAMTTKRSYKDALNPIGVVSDLFRKYADKDRMLQFILHSFMEVVGIYPTGGIVYLTNGQMAYIVESKGPILLPFTDTEGKTLKHPAAPIDLSKQGQTDQKLSIDRRKQLISPIEVFNQLPEILKNAIN